MSEEKIVKSFSTTIYTYGGPGARIVDKSLENQIKEFVEVEKVEPVSFSITSSVVDRSNDKDGFWKDYVCTAIGIFEKRK